MNTTLWVIAVGAVVVLAMVLLTRQRPIVIGPGGPVNPDDPMFEDTGPTGGGDVI